MDRKGYIYSLEYPEGNIRYIGKSFNPYKRFLHHLYPSNNQKKGYKWNWIKSLKEKGLKPIMKIIDEVSAEEIDFWEIHYISLFKFYGFRLTNMTLGGDGQSHISEETKLIISKKIKEYKSIHPNWNKGTKGLMSKNRLGKKQTELAKFKVSLN